MAAQPVLATAVKERLQVVAIDFGTTYSGYAFSFKADFQQNPLKITTNNWEYKQTGSPFVSSKAPTCALFTPDKDFHSFGFEAEDHYTKLAIKGQHNDWFFFKRFKMLLYDNKVRFYLIINILKNCKWLTFDVKYLNENCCFVTNNT